MSRFMQNKELLMSYLKTHPYMADALVKVSPEKEPGDHCSVVLYKGYRIWCFATEADRAAFLKRHRHAKQRAAI